jgi:3-oxoacyl-[acyl-carrier-protein] synthase-3
MHGRKIYEFNYSSAAMAVWKSGIAIDDVKKILIHQANEKMDETSYNDFINCMTDQFLRIICL